MSWQFRKSFKMLPGVRLNLTSRGLSATVGGKTMGARQKDKVEDLLKKQVCDGTITLKEAQDQIAGDWYKIYLANF
jgi:hypothetical protein